MLMIVATMITTMRTHIASMATMMMTMMMVVVMLTAKILLADGLLCCACAALLRASGISTNSGMTMRSRRRRRSQKCLWPFIGQPVSATCFPLRQQTDNQKGQITQIHECLWTTLCSSKGVHYDVVL